jgi:hypothetical protein
MPVVFYILGIISALGCANFTYAAVGYSEPVESTLQIVNFQMAHASAVAIALGCGIISAIFFSTGAIIETMRRRERD